MTPREDAVVVEGGTDLDGAARALVLALETQRDAINGAGHPGEDHDTYLHFDPCTNLPGVKHIRDEVRDCAACGGAQYGSDLWVNVAVGDLRAALGLEVRPWERA